MPTFVHTVTCGGYKAGEVTACMYICPHDLMKLDVTRKKAFNRESEQCWEGQCCGLACPQQAIEVRSFADWVPMGGAIIPLRTASAIMSTIKFRDEVKRFRPIYSAMAAFSPFGVDAPCEIDRMEPA